MYGHILEQMVLFFVKLSGHEVTHEQKSVKVSGISGHMDCVIDGEVIDVKHTERGMEYVISWNDGHNVIQLPADSVTSDSDDSEPEDKPHGGDTGKDADSETPKAISDAAPEVQEDIGERVQGQADAAKKLGDNINSFFSSTLTQ